LKLENYNNELNRSNQELQQFAYVASHDLQEPVRKILFYSNYLLNSNGDIDSRSLKYLSNIHDSSKRMRSLIQDLLSFSMINKAAVNFQLVDLNEILGEVLQDLEIAITQKNAEIEAMPLPNICGDVNMMRQLFSNLINNSLKFSKAFLPPVITISSQENGHLLEIIMKDNGIGFDEKYTTRIFDLFKRLHSRESYDGTGLGLAICKKIVELHNGTIWATGTEDTGACFHFSLPRATADK
jgi:light-regulated signal transduction histidine kinase (bacteriophytochrome)